MTDGVRNDNLPKHSGSFASGTSPLAEAPLFPFLDLRAQFAGIRQEVLQAVHSVMESQQFILGTTVECFEREVSRWMGSRFAVGCASGSDALFLSLLALHVEPCDEVITTPFTFFATGGSVARLHARPVFVDIDPETFNIDSKQVESAITERTRVIIPVHLFGLPAEMDALLDIAGKHGIAVIEDAAQAMGARHRGRFVGTLGTFGCFSFFPSKNLGGAGDGGLLTSNDPVLAARVRLLRVHGSPKKYHHELLGVNSRLDALQAAILRVKLAHLTRWTEERQDKADSYRELFNQYGLDRVVKLPSVPEGCEHVFNQYVIRCLDRDRLRAFLRTRGIPTEIYYPLPLHLQPAFADLGYKAGQFPQTEAASREVLALPIYPELSGEHQTTVVRNIAQFYSGGN